MSTLNSEQQRAIEHVEGPCLVIAGAGAGKTRVVTERIGHLLSIGVPASDILAVTFTNKAASEMATRVSGPRVLISTFHSLGARILRESISHLGYKNDFVIYDEEDSLKLIRSCLNDLGVSPREIKPKTFRVLIGQAKNALQQVDELDTASLTTSVERLLPQVYALYQRKLKENNGVDFDDLLFLCVQLFQNHPEVLASYQLRWPFVLIDEYQDINHAQYLMATSLVAKSHNLFVVGDPDQSIYSWRGAELTNILNFERDFPGAKVVKLEQNYRSTETILDASNALISHNIGRYDKKLWSGLGEGDLIELAAFDSDREEASWIAGEIECTKAPLKDVAIFYRTNAQSRSLEDALLYKDLPYVIVGGISFYQRKEIKDLLAYLRMCDTGSDFLSFARSVNLPKRGLGEASIEKIRLLAITNGLTILQAAKMAPDHIRLSNKGKEGLAEYVSVIEALRDMKETAPVAELISLCIDKVGYLTLLKADRDTYQERKENVNELIAKAVEWEEGGNQSLTLFLEELALKTSGDGERTSDRIHLMTLHNSKGLEFNTVYLIGMEEGLFPHANASQSPDQIEEERRLCYVGMTRAKQKLVLSWSRYRYLWGESQMMMPSRFLKEIPDQYTHSVQGDTHIGQESDFFVGDEVYHKDFGPGIVEETFEGTLGLVCKIFFKNDHTIKTIVTKYAKLSKV